MAALMADVRRAARISMGMGSIRINVTGQPEEFSLRKVETCWDIGGAGFDAQQVLKNLTPTLREWGARRVTEGNAGSITIEFTDSEKLVVYAKTPNRLRMEIRHSPPKGNIPYTAPTIEGILAKMNEFRCLAAKRINKLLGPLRARLAAPLAEWDWCPYALEWGACCGNSDESRAILETLMREGRILGGKYVECVSGGAKLLRKARDRGLLRHELGAFHPIMPGGAEPSLTSFGNAASFLGHKTETQPIQETQKIPTTRRIVRELNRIPPSPPSVDYQQVARIYAYSWGILGFWFSGVSRS